MKIDWTEYNKDFNTNTEKELKNISDCLLVSYLNKESDNQIEKISLLSFHKTATGDKLGVLDGHLCDYYFGWIHILKYCPIEV